MRCPHIHGVLIVRDGNYWTDLPTQFRFWTQPINLGFKFGYFTLDGFKFSEYWLSSWHNIRRCMAHSNLAFVSLVGAPFPCYKPHPDQCNIYPELSFLAQQFNMQALPLWSLESPENHEHSKKVDPVWYGTNLSTLVWPAWVASNAQENSDRILGQTQMMVSSI